MCAQILCDPLSKPVTLLMYADGLLEWLRGLDADSTNSRSGAEFEKLHIMEGGRGKIIGYSNIVIPSQNHLIEIRCPTVPLPDDRPSTSQRDKFGKGIWWNQASGQACRLASSEQQ